MELRSLARDCSCSYRSTDSHGRFVGLGHIRPLVYGEQRRRLRTVLFPRTQDVNRDLPPPKASDLTADLPQEPDDEPPVVDNIFPRIRESNPYR